MSPYPMHDKVPPATSAQPVEFGAGNWVIVTGTFNARPAVFIEPSKTPGKVGESAEKEGIPRDRLIPGALVFTFPTAEQAKSVADAICCPAASAPAEVEGLVERGNTLTKGLVEWGDNEPRLSRGDWREINSFVRDATSRLTELQATIARLTAERDNQNAELAETEAERDEALASAAAAYERAAAVTTYHYNTWGDKCEHPLDRETQEIISALATEAETNALAEIVDAETRDMRKALEDLLKAHESGWPDKQDWGAGDRARATIARLDQRKEGV